MYPTFRFHATEAPQGKRFTDEAELDALGPEWVDTPAKFAPTGAEKPAIADTKHASAEKKGRKAKETA